jgi:hypothetical protein
MKKISQVTVLLFLLVSTRCKKDVFKNEISGYVKEAGTGKALKGVEVALFSSCYIQNGQNPGSCRNGNKELYKTTTDDGGYYCIRYDKFRNGDKYYTAFNDGAHFVENYAIPDRSKNKLSHDQALIAPAEIKLHIKNVTPFDNADEFYIPPDFFSTGNPSFEVRLKGKEIDTIIGPFTCNGNIEIKPNWGYIKNGILYRTDILINPPGFKTTTFEVNY